MFPYGLPFGQVPEDSEEDLTVDSSKEDLWEEIVELRDKLKMTESGKITAERRLEQTIDAKALEGKPVLIVRGASSYEDLEEIAKMWSQKHPTGAVFALPPDMDVQDLSDADLASVGLRRVANGPVTERDLYDGMLCGR